jgi:hypothetical protein
MTTSQLKCDAYVLETRYVWGRTIQDAMTKAYSMVDWSVQGNPAPMTYNGQYGTGVAITRVNDA